MSAPETDREWGVREPSAPATARSARRAPPVPSPMPAVFYALGRAGATGDWVEAALAGVILYALTCAGAGLCAGLVALACRGREVYRVRAKVRDHLQTLAPGHVVATTLKTRSRAMGWIVDRLARREVARWRRTQPSA